MATNGYRRRHGGLVLGSVITGLLMVVVIPAALAPVAARPLNETGLVQREDGVYVPWGAPENSEQLKAMVRARTETNPQASAQVRPVPANDGVIRADDLWAETLIVMALVAALGGALVLSSRNRSPRTTPDMVLNNDVGGVALAKVAKARLRSRLSRSTSALEERS